MQISRTLLVACAAACATTLAVRGNDTPAQIKAREALRQKLQQSPPDATVPAAPAAPAAPVPRADSQAISKARDALHQQMAQPASAVAAPEPAPAAVPMPAPASAPVAAASDAPVPPAVAPVQQAEPDAIAKARDAVRQKIQESPGTPPPAPAAAPTAAPSPAVAATPIATPPAAPKVVPPIASEPSPDSSAPESDSIAKARQALRQQISGDTEAGPKADAESLAKAREALRQRMQGMTYVDPASRGGSTVGSNFIPLEGPPLPISSEKHERLNGLLQRYRADQLTPEQYQAERAKILAGP
jgi:hypothetical protein